VGKIFANHISNKGLILKIYYKLTQFSVQKTNKKHHPNLKWAVDTWE